VLAPLADLGAGARAKLTETLRCWLLHQGRREQVAAELFVHPRTVRYRMGQLRELYGDRLEDPRTVLELMVALGAMGRP
jgi:DNA-binding PucR family transcriptional regulator